MHSSIKRENSSKTLPKIKRALACAALLLCVLAAISSAPGIALADGAAECVCELSTGKIIHSRNAEARLPMASTTKIMTALIILEGGETDSVITVPDEAVGEEGSSIYLRKGEKISVIDLLYGLMLRSGNDAAKALAIWHSGSVEAFAEVMNERAAEMGLENTHFVNASGLPDDNHYTTASDLLVIACRAMKNSQFKAIVSSRNYSGEYRSFVNKNKLLYTLEGANGVKTGYTLKAGRCLVSSAERQGMDVVCVVLNCPDMYERSASLIEAAFKDYQKITIGGSKVFMCGGLPCNIGDDCDIVVKRGSELEVRRLPADVGDEVKCGDVVGQLEIYCENDLIFGANLYSIVYRRKTF